MFRREVEQHCVAQRREFVYDPRCRRERTVRFYLHKRLTEQAEHAQFHPVSFDNHELAPRVVSRDVCGAAEVFERVYFDLEAALVPDVVAERECVDTRAEEFLRHIFRYAVAARGVFAVCHDEIHVQPLPNGRQVLGYDFAPRLADNIAYEENPHLVISGIRDCGRGRSYRRLRPPLKVRGELGQSDPFSNRNRQAAALCCGKLRDVS